MQQSNLSLKDFQVVRILGNGSFGKVELVRKKQNNQLYALKSVSLSRLNQKERQNALNQVRLLASIQIPTVIGYEGAFFDLESQSLCVVLQYADGGDLQQKIVQQSDLFDQQGFDEDFIWKVAFQILQGLKTLHKNNIIHRDIKSANIFFSKGVAKLGDLNVSKIAEEGMCSTQTGTPYYTSPQIWSGQAYGNKCDIWSSGCLFYQMCTLIHPFKAFNFPQLYRKITSGVYRDIPKKYSNELRWLIKMTLTVDESMRPSAAELLENVVFDKIRQRQEHEGVVNIVEPIKCPRVLRFLNSRLPQPKEEFNYKKTVCFNAKMDLGGGDQKENKFRQIKSEKLINLPFQDEIPIQFKGNVKSKINMPLAKKAEKCQQQVTGLSFSARKLRVRPISSKMIPQPLSSRVLN